MKRAVAVAASTAIASGLVLVAAGPSTAATTGSARAASGVLWDDCFDHRVSYSVGAAAGAEDWTLDLDVIAPDGRSAGGDFLMSGVDAASGASSVFFCGGVSRPGTYKIRGTITAYDADYNATTYAIPTSSFTMRQPRTTSALAAKPKKTRVGKVVRLTGTSKVERPRGYYALTTTRVRLQQKVKGTWRNVKAAEYTNYNGRTAFRVKAKKKGTMSFRLRTPSSSTETGSVSKVVKVRVRG
ncbi:hypothetical protein FE697_017320 [Mumia zhuanghuii]|uniref:Uncharacterized protein n=2 Tax=Mumia TaxID=1546255 RepID=A0ABW1QNS5_9ACTN|nr:MULTISPECIES: hypothetical protein [Mumia]KAA1420698.1 hypothetical protein FE697_017320 [Mumia zhuanghuii]